MCFLNMSISPYSSIHEQSGILWIDFNPYSPQLFKIKHDAAMDIGILTTNWAVDDIGAGVLKTVAAQGLQVECQRMQQLTTRYHFGNYGRDIFGSCMDRVVFSIPC